GTLTIHYEDASNGQVYWQPWRCRAGTKSGMGPFFELGRPLAIETDGPPRFAPLLAILRFVHVRDREGQSGVMSLTIAEALGRDHADVYDDIAILIDEGYVRADPMGGIAGGAW